MKELRAPDIFSLQKSFEVLKSPKKMQKKVEIFIMNRRDSLVDQKEIDNLENLPVNSPIPDA